MSLKSEYDIVVYGTSLSAYIGAALFSSLGRSVLLIDDSKIEEFEEDEEFFIGEEQSLLSKTLQILELNEFLKKEEKNPFVQVLSPKFRISFFKEINLFQQALRREIPETQQSLWPFFEKIFDSKNSIPGFFSDVFTPGQMSRTLKDPWMKYWGKYSSDIFSSKNLLENFKTIFNSENDQKILIDLVRAVYTGTTYNISDHISIETLVKFLCLNFSGREQLNLSKAEFKKVLTEFLQKNSGAVKKNASLQTILFENKKVSSVVLSSYEGVIQTKHVFLTKEIKRVHSTFKSEIKNRVLDWNLSRIEPKSWWHFLVVSFDNSVVPLGSTDRMIYVGSPIAPFEEENFIKIRRLNSDNKQKAKFLISSAVPFKPSLYEPFYLRRLSGKMLRILSEIMPFLDFKTAEVYPNVMDPEQRFSKCYSFEEGLNSIPEERISYYVRGEKSLQSSQAIHWTSPYSNLFFGGRTVYPSMGAYGELLCSYKVFEELKKPERWV